MECRKNSEQGYPPPLRKISLALQGGGTHGAFTWGVLDRLLEDERLEIEGISGTSAGGLNAVALTQGLLKGGRHGARKELRRLWQEIANMALTSPFQNSPYERFLGLYNLDYSPGYISMNFFNNFLSPYEFNPLNIDPFQEFVKNFFDFEVLQTCEKIKLFLCATQVSSGKLKIFSTKDLCLNVVLASACLPSFFHAVKIGHEYYWDGGFVGNPAIYPLIYHCNTPDIMIVQLSVLRRKQLPQTHAEIRDRHKEITYNACLMREMRSIDFITELIDRGIIDSTKIKRLFIHLIRNEPLFHALNLSSALNASWDFLEFLHHHGREAASTWLNEHFDDLGKRTTTDIHKDFVA